ncbi:DUF4179 domain-containing protein [Gracilibacillus oryzae]|uniref:DUF4179 domain-containing protein n=1 Tax=Gracilibacillus oryzae TaxID=1672701 RepID=A0A7C8KP19_9BACI|nr:DUF4179 domain-containing protein [Gracilibacillus oryzae]KAB8129373.1 DUF4179 domain-containing protein [Gracilibacillus oryzae]
MSNKEERALQEWKTQTKEHDVTTSDLDQAIELGMGKVKKRNRRIKQQLGGIISMAILIVSLVTLVNVSPVFASQLAKIPGMEMIIELAKWNKSIQTAVENDYYQSINKTVTKGDLSLTIDGVIRDENGVVAFITLSSDKQIGSPRVEQIELRGSNGEEIKSSAITYPTFDHKENNQFRSIFTVLATDESISWDSFEMDAEVSAVEKEDDGVGNVLKEEFVIPFDAENTSESIHYKVDKVVSIEGQKINVKSVTIRPLRVEVELYADPNNTMQILSIDDLALIDEKGEVWSSENGIIASGSIDRPGYKVYLQSNYFENPESLSLTFSKLQAVEKGKDYMRFNLATDEILFDPYGKFYDMNYENHWLHISTDDTNEIPASPFGSIFDQNGNEIKQEQSSSSFRYEDDSIIYGESIYTDEDIIDVKLTSYPHWIKEKVTIPLK